MIEPSPNAGSGALTEGDGCPSCGALIVWCDCEETEESQGHLICLGSGDDAGECIAPDPRTVPQNPSSEKAS